MKAIKLKMKQGSSTSNSLLEIDSIYLKDCTNPGYFKKEVLHNHLEENPGSIQVDISPYPNLIPALSSNNEKYVRSNPNSTTDDNLMNLPKE